MTRELVFHRAARADLFDIYDHIERQSGPARAGAYLARIQEACDGLKDFPERGKPRHDIAAGVRTWSIERRVFQVCLLAERQETPIPAGLADLRSTKLDQSAACERPYPSSTHPVTPPIITFTGNPSPARCRAALSVPLQWGPAQ